MKVIQRNLLRDVETVKPEAEIVHAVIPPSKQRGKKKGQEVTAVLSGEVIESDYLTDINHEIEDTPEEAALKVVGELAAEIEWSWFELGGLLSAIQQKGWYTGNKQYASLREFVEQELDLRYLTVAYWINIFNCLVESKVPWSKISMLSWSKIKEIALVINPENADHWVQVSNSNDIDTLTKLVDRALAKKHPSPIDEKAPKAVMTKTLQVRADQKQAIEDALATAKIMLGTDDDAVALGFICNGFNAGSLAEVRTLH
jgi:hypothetical protein